MLSTAKNVSRYYKLPGRETVKGPLIYKCFENIINNQSEKLLNEVDIYGLHFQGDVSTIKEKPLLNIFVGRVHLPVSVQKIVYCTSHITGGHKIYMKRLLRIVSLFQ